MRMKTRMNSRGRFFASLWIVPAAAALVFAVGGCHSRSERQAEETSPEPVSAAPAQSASGPNLDLDCVVDEIQKPTESFHYSYKKDDNGVTIVQQEADITPQTIDGTRKSGDTMQPFHGVRSEAQNWQSAWINLMGISGMSSTIALVNHSSAMVKEGDEKMNGYDTTRFSIDTSRGNSAELGLYRATMGDGGFEKGTVWVTPQGCPAKLILDSEMHMRNGTVDKTHYEIEMVKK